MIPDRAVKIRMLLICQYTATAFVLFSILPVTGRYVRRLAILGPGRNFPATTEADL